MKIVCIASALCLFSVASSVFGQAAAAPKPAAQVPTESLVVDVHPAPYRPKIVYTTNISNQRFDMRNATILDIIEFAYGLGDQDDDRENAAIVGGPTWIDLDRFDVIANIPSLKPTTLNAGSVNPASRPGNPNDQVRPVLKRVLAERFHLKYHNEDRPLPGYVVTVAKEGSKLTLAKDPSAEGNCRAEQDKANLNQVTFSCTSETIAQLFSAVGPAFPHPVIDHTGLTKPYEFTYKLVYGPQVHTRDDMARLYTEALKPLGLVVAPGDVPQPAIVVDSVERPTANPPDIAKLIPPLPDLEFEVASIRLAADNEPQTQIRPSGSQITFYGFTLQDLLVRAWQLPTGAMLGTALPLLPRTRFTILVKLPPDISGLAVYQDQDQIDGMLQKLLVDRFGVKYHWGEWTPPDAWVLLASAPKMKNADPNSRTFCKFGPAEGEKTARTENSPYDREFHCQNVSMAQFADLVQPLAGSDVKTRVPDKTGLAGSYDFTVYYTSAHTMRVQTIVAAAEAKQNGDATPAPVAGLSLQDAFRKELGLKLERGPVTQPALILDHFEQTPTDN